MASPRLEVHTIGVSECLPGVTRALEPFRLLSPKNGINVEDLKPTQEGGGRLFRPLTPPAQEAAVLR